MRGGGTSQAGQAIGSGIVIDTSKYLQSPARGECRGALGPRRAGHRPRRAERCAQAARPALRARHLDRQPRHRRRHDGQQLRRRAIGALRQDHRPRDRSARRAVRRIDGLVPRARPARARGGLRRRHARGACYRAVRDAARQHADEIERRFPKVLRRVAGYNLDAFVDPRQPFNLAKLMVGSEGTLGIVVEARLNLVPLARRQGRARDSVRRSARGAGATPAILAHQPSAVEVMDGFILDHTRQSEALERLRRTFIDGDPAALICVEFYADRAEDLPPRLEALERDLAARHLGYRYTRAIDAASQAAIWSLREAALGLSMAMKGDAKSLSFVEDTAVPPERLARLHRSIPAEHPQSRHRGRHLRARLGRLPPRAAGRQPQDRSRRQAVRSDCQRQRRSRPRIRRRAVRRARRRPGAQPVHGEDVRRADLSAPFRTSSARSIPTACSIPARSSTRRR